VRAQCGQAEKLDDAADARRAFAEIRAMERREWGHQVGLGLPGQGAADHGRWVARESVYLVASDPAEAGRAQAEVRDGFAEFWQAIPGLVEPQGAPPAVRRLPVAGKRLQDAGRRLAAAPAGADFPAKEDD
jgi:hypothetical protein